MNRRLVPAVIALAALAPLSPALAFSFAPASQPFVSSGRMNFAGAGFRLDCHAVFSGETEAAGDARIDDVRFSGGLLGSCRNVRPLGLPWRVKAAGPAGMVISSVHVDAPLVGECEGRDVPAVIDAKGVIRFGQFPLPPRCKVAGGALTTKPLVTIVGS